MGTTLADARKKAYDAMADIHLQGSFYRKDIGFKA
jgi:phosphoribosylamine-glycine ligase